MKDELMLIDGLDQSVPISSQDEDEIYQRVDALIQKSLTEKNAYIALNTCRELVKVSKISGLALAKIFYALQQHWDEFGIEEELVVMLSEYTGLHAHTVERYLDVQAMYEQNLIPKELEGHIRQLNIMSQIPIAKALKQGYEIEDDDWQKLAEAPDFSTISAVIREDVKGKEPRKGSLQLYLDKIGSIWADADGNRYFVGSLEVDDDEDTVQKAIARITANSGMLKGS